MDQTVNHRDQLLAQVGSSSDLQVVAAAKGLLEIGECGTPQGTYLLAGGKAALRQWMLADAVVLLYHGLRVVEPHTLLWSEMLVNRATACAHHGFYRDAIAAGQQFLGALCTLPEEAQRFVPHAHHAIGFGFDRLRRFDAAATHFKLAAEGYVEVSEKVIAYCDYAAALVMNGQADKASAVLSTLPVPVGDFVRFVYHSTQTLVAFHQGRFADATDSSALAQAVAAGHEDAWAVPLAELRYWESRSAWELGDRYRSTALALKAAVVASKHHHLPLLDTANDWLAHIMENGGITGGS